MISEEIANQMSRILNEIKNSLNSQIQNAINTAMAENVLPCIQNTLAAQGRANCTMVDRGSNGLHDSPRAIIFTTEDRRSSGRQRNSEVGNVKKTWENCPRKCFVQENSRQMSRQSSTDFYNSEQNRNQHKGHIFQQKPSSVHNDAKS